MGVCSIGFNAIRLTEALRHVRTMPGKVMHVHNACDRMNAAGCNAKLIQQPVFWNLAVGIGVGEPAFLRIPGEALQSHPGRQRTCYADDTGAGTHNCAGVAEYFVCNVTSAVDRTICDDDDIAGTGIRQGCASRLDRMQAMRQQLFLIARGNQNRDVTQAGEVCSRLILLPHSNALQPI